MTGNPERLRRVSLRKHFNISRSSALNFAVANIFAETIYQTVSSWYLCDSSLDSVDAQSC